MQICELSSCGTPKVNYLWLNFNLPFLSKDSIELFQKVSFVMISDKIVKVYGIPFIYEYTNLLTQQFKINTVVGVNDYGLGVAALYHQLYHIYTTSEITLVEHKRLAECYAEFKNTQPNVCDTRIQPHILEAIRNLVNNRLISIENVS